VFVRERGEGDPLLMINGLGGNVEMWGAAEERLCRSARTIVFDAPGSGRSPTPAWPLSIGGLARVVADALDQLGYQRVDVLGFSLGGLVAQELARDDARVRRLALVATACGWGSMPGTLQALTLVSMPLRYHSRALYEQTRQLLSPADAALLRRHTALSDARLRHPPPILGYLTQLWACALWSSLTWLPSVRTPTLVVHGDGDHLVPAANATQLARLLSNSRLHVLPDEGHLLVFDPDGAALPLLEDFYSSPAPEESRAWSTGITVDDDATVETAFRNSPGASPHRELSTMFRWFVQHGFHQNGYA
jgi:pimeloyl-ACP methyl ester carboxylesterase